MNSYDKWITGLRHWVYFPKSKVLKFLDFCDESKGSRVITNFGNIEHLAKECSNLSEIADIVADIAKGIKQQAENSEAIKIARSKKDYKMMFNLEILGHISSDLETAIFNLLQTPMIDEGDIITDYIIWKDYQYDLLQLSKQYPDNIFLLNYQGLFWNDLGRLKAQNGLVTEKSPLIIYKTDY